MKNEECVKSQTTSRNRPKNRRPWISFGKNEDGTAAIEFAIVAMPFFLIIFAILEFSFIFFGERIIHVSTQDAARLIKTGQIRGTTTTEEQFRTEMCTNTLMRLFDCDSLHINVQEIPNFGPPPPLPFRADGTIDPSNFVFAPGGTAALNIVMLYYEWPLFVNWGGLGIASWSTNKEALIGTTHAFRNEPF
jgi:Flp pilus assembly protein TadG